MIALLAIAAAIAAGPAPHPAAAVQGKAGAPAVEIWRVDQLRVARDTDPAKLKAIEPDHSLAAVMARLKALGVPFTRQQVEVVPGRLPPQLEAEIANLPAGEPFVLPEPDFISISVIVGRRLPPGSVLRVQRGREAA